MGFTRITEDDINNKGVVGLPDTPNLSTAEMQEKFDEIALAVIIPKVNNLIAEIEAKTASAGIGIDVDDELSEEKKLQPAFAKLYEIVKSLGSSNHSHDNKDALDGITDTLLTELNEIITLLDGITDVSNEINGRATALATCKAVADYVQELGGGDMTRAMYDTNRNGIVDDAEKLGGNLPEYYQSATDETLQTTDKTIVGAINEVKTGLENAEVDTLTTLEQVEASTDDTIPVGAGAVKELNESLNEIGNSFGKVKKLIEKETTTTNNTITYNASGYSGIIVQIISGTNGNIIATQYFPLDFLNVENARIYMPRKLSGWGDDYICDVTKKTVTAVDGTRFRIYGVK